MKMKFRNTIFFLAFALFSCGESKTQSQNTSSVDTVTNLSNNQATITNDESIVGIDCPPEGNASSEKLQALNILKNRIIFPKQTDFNPNISLVSLLANGDDRNRWSNETAGKIIGYVRDVKAGGVETTNCKSKEKDLRDTHIELVLNPMSNEKNECVIVEITPRLRKIMSAKGIDWSTSMIRSKYLGRWIEVEGWMLFDFEHSNMAENTHPNNLKNWRGTSWEIHPVTNIKIADKH